MKILVSKKSHLSGVQAIYSNGKLIYKDSQAMTDMKIDEPHRTHAMIDDADRRVME